MTTAKQPTTALGAGSTSPEALSAGARLLEELKDWQRRAKALPFDTLGLVPEYFANWNAKAVAVMVAHALEHVETWGPVSRAGTGEPDRVPRGMTQMLYFMPGIVHDSGHVTPPTITLTMNDKEPQPEDWTPDELAILLRAKSEAYALRAKREDDDIGWKEIARHAGADADFCEAWKKHGAEQSQIRRKMIAKLGTERRPATPARSTRKAARS